MKNCSCKSYKIEFDYWIKRALAAERFIEESPCDPDILDEQIKAHSEWQEIKSKEV